MSKTTLEPTPKTVRYQKVREIIEREAAPLLEQLDDKTVEQLENIALYPGTKGSDGQPIRKTESEKLIESLPHEQKDAADKLYQMFRRACRGGFARYGKLYLIGESGAEISAEEAEKVLGQIPDTRRFPVEEIITIRDEGKKE